jgi:nucleoid-associated protein YgaU
VVVGDNLWTIAKGHLAATRGRPAATLSDREVAAYWLKVVDANRQRLRSRDPDLIYPGEQVTLPPVAGA